MARDYSNGNGRSKTTAKTKGKRKAAQPRKRRNAPKKNTRKQQGAPRWVWLGSALFIGLAVAAVFYIASRPTGHPGRDYSDTEVPQPEKTAATTQQDAAPKNKISQQPKYAFYEMLPNYEVVIPGQTPQPDTSATNSANSSSNAHSSQDTDSTSTEASTDNESQDSTSSAYPPGHYILQVGAFTKTEDANQLKARVTLLGLHANVVRVERESAGTIYRVRSDVIDSASRLTQLVERMHEHDIPTLVLRRND